MKKSLLSFVIPVAVLTLLVSGASSVLAVSATPTVTPIPPTVFCYNWATNFRVGDSGAGIDALHTALRKEGFVIVGDNAPSFSEQTASAVVGFQEKYASEILTPNGLSHGTGYVGPSTRAKLNQLYGCNSGGGGGGGGNACYQFRTNLTIGSNGADVVALQTWLIAKGFDIPLISTGGVAKGYFGPSTSAAVGRYQASVGLPATGELVGEAGENMRLKVNASCGTISTTPTATILTSNQTTAVTPYIIGTASGVRQVGIVLSSSSGDKVYGSGTIPVVSGNWSVTVSPALALGGYTIRVYDSNNNLLTTGYINIVSSISTQPSITVLSPNGGESFAQGAVLSGSFETSLVPYTSSCEAAIVGRKPDGSPVDAIIATLRMVASDRQTFSGQIPVNLVPPGAYKIRVNCGEDASLVQDQSDSYFTITFLATTTEQTASISGTVQLISANEDKAPKWGAGGYIHAPDWKWSVNLTNSGSTAKTVKRMILVHNTPGEGWATDASANNPLGKFLYTLAITPSQSSNAEVYTQQTNALLPLWTISGNGGSKSFYAYGYPASQTFSGGYLSVDFTDGTSARITIPASSIRPGTGTTTNRPPVISGLTAPTTLNVNQTGTWTVNASDPENGPLTYSVIWGDEAQKLTPALLDSMKFTQTASFSHSYAYAGTYTATFVVKDNAGLSVQTTATVQVGNATQPSVTVMSAGTDVIIDPSLMSTSNAIFTARVTDGSGKYTYYWDFGDGTGSAGTILQGSNDTMGHRYTNPGVYNVSVYVIDSNGQRSKVVTTTITARLISSQLPTVQSSVTAILIDASADKAGTGFGPGLGIPNPYQNKNPNDWHWRATVTTGEAKTLNISSITINHNAAGETWSTADSRYYPVVVLKNGVQTNQSYGTLVDITSDGTTVLDLYGQPETSTFSGGTITVKFADGTSVSSTIPSSTIKQTPVSTNDQTGATWDAVREYYRRQGR